MHDNFLGFVRRAPAIIEYAHAYNINNMAATTWTGVYKASIRHVFGTVAPFFTVYVGCKSLREHVLRFVCVL